MISNETPAKQGSAVFTPTLGVPANLAPEFLTPGMVVGRYRIVERLAIGGMGVVFKAHDPELSRHVALKLVQPSSIDIEPQRAAEEYEQRLLREAQALARLSHPNVVAAFDVGRFAGALFIAMELIDGESLSSWLFREKRALAEILRVLLDAGRGLSAAHRAGVVHRDFKLTNVMVSEQGRVQVVDFGLARTLGVMLEANSSVCDATAHESPADAPASGLSNGELTRTGAVLGTPGYIAPEQFLGAAADERSDQFSYASAAFRALTGRSAYAIDSLTKYRGGVLEGERARWPKSIPRAVRKVIDRGLSRRPEDRYPHVDALLDDLERAARPKRKFAFLVLLALGMSAVVSTLSLRERWMLQRCEPDPRAFEGVWGGVRSARIESAFRGSGSARADESLAAINATVASFRERWQDARRQACSATYERHEQSEQILALRNACLDSKLRQFATLADLFEGADRALVDRAPEALDELARVSECSDILSLVSEDDRLPDDGERREPIEALLVRWDTLQATYVTGRWSAVLDQGQTLARDAEQVGYKPIQARAMSHAVMALERLGQQDDAGTLRRRTLQLAADAKVHDVLARQSLRLLRSAVDAMRLVEAKAMLPFVEANIGLAGRPAALVIPLLTYHAAIVSEEGDYDGAIELLARALAECRQLGAEGLRYCLSPQRELGLVHGLRKDHAEALRELETTIELAKRALGPRHPNVVNEYNNAAMIMLRLRDAETAAGFLAESKRLAASLPPDRQMANIPQYEGELLALRGDCRAALALFEESARRLAAVYGKRSMQASQGPHELGKCLIRLGEPAAAIPHLEHALELRRANAMKSDWIANSSFALAQALWSSPAQRLRARQLAEEARTLYQKAGKDFVEDAKQVSAWLDARAPGRR